MLYTTVAVDGKINLKCILFYFILLYNDLHHSPTSYFADGWVYFVVWMVSGWYCWFFRSRLREDIFFFEGFTKFTNYHACATGNGRVWRTPVRLLRHSFSRVLLGQFSHDLTFDASLPLLAGHPDYLYTKVNAIEITRSSCEEGNCTDAWRGWL